jgi:hypothetical protein
LNNVSVRREGDRVVVSGLAVNVGTETATIVGINALFYDLGGLPRWVDVGYLDTNIYPGQSASFSFDAPLATAVGIVAEVLPEDVVINGRGLERDFNSGDPRSGTIPVPPESGYSSVRLQVSTMTHEPLL